MYFRKCILAALLAATSLSSTAKAQENQVFGSKEVREGALIGIFYDLKQTQDLQPSKVRYLDALDGFLKDGLHESHLNGFFRAGLPLYSTQIYIPRMNAENAPKAFGVDAVVEPKRWIIHYKGQVVPPEDGTYRFVGGGDDIFVVAVNGEVVLVGNHPSVKFPTLEWRPSQGNNPRPAVSGYAQYGTWLNLKANEPIDLDIIIGEYPGGVFNAGLAYQKRDESYSTNSKGGPILPLFQLAPMEVNFRGVTTNQPLWKALP